MEHEQVTESFEAKHTTAEPEGDDTLDADLAEALDGDELEDNEPETPDETPEEMAARVAAEVNAWKAEPSPVAAAAPTVAGVAPGDQIQIGLLRQGLEIALAPWGNSAISPNARSPEPTGAARVQASLEVLNHALRKLGKRDRAGSRVYLEARRDKMASKLALVTELGRWLERPGADKLIGRAVAVLKAVAAARAALQNATRANVLTCRAELDLCEADEREFAREIASIKERLVFPNRSLIEPAVVEQAKAATKYLADNVNGNRAMITHMALDGGRDATPDEARLWICFEPASGGELFDLRWARFLAAHPEAVAA